MHGNVHTPPSGGYHAIKAAPGLQTRIAAPKHAPDRIGTQSAAAVGNRSDRNRVQTHGNVRTPPSSGYPAITAAPGSQTRIAAPKNKLPIESRPNRPPLSVIVAIEIASKRMETFVHRLFAGYHSIKAAPARRRPVLEPKNRYRFASRSTTMSVNQF